MTFRNVRPLKLSLAAAVLLLGGAALTGCANTQTDRCYLSMDKYRPIRALFLETGSMQRVEEAMAEAQWAACERNQLRYLLAKDLYLDDLQEELESMRY